MARRHRNATPMPPEALDGPITVRAATPRTVRILLGGYDVGWARISSRGWSVNVQADHEEDAGESILHLYRERQAELYEALNRYVRRKLAAGDPVLTDMYRQAARRF